MSKAQERAAFTAKVLAAAVLSAGEADETTKELARRVLGATEAAELDRALEAPRECEHVADVINRQADVVIDAVDRSRGADGRPDRRLALARGMERGGLVLIDAAELGALVRERVDLHEARGRIAQLEVAAERNLGEPESLGAELIDAHGEEFAQDPNVND